jgi:hypothetical protein
MVWGLCTQKGSSKTNLRTSLTSPSCAWLRVVTCLDAVLAQRLARHKALEASRSQRLQLEQSESAATECATECATACVLVRHPDRTMQALLATRGVIVLWVHFPNLFHLLARTGEMRQLKDICSLKTRFWDVEKNDSHDGCQFDALFWPRR